MGADKKPKPRRLLSLRAQEAKRVRLRKMVETRRRLSAMNLPTLVQVVRDQKAPRLSSIGKEILKERYGASWKQVVKRIETEEQQTRASLLSEYFGLSVDELNLKVQKRDGD